MIKQLHETWNSAWYTLGCVPKDDLFTPLVNRYRQVNRVYHNLDHLQHTLAVLNSSAFMDSLTPVQHACATLALFYHDAKMHYEMREAEHALAPGGSPEFASGVLFSVDADICALTSEHVGNILWAILATRWDKEVRKTVIESRRWVAQIVCDCDLAVLSGHADEYYQYARKVYQEATNNYPHMTKVEYMDRRIAFLKSCVALGEKNLYCTGLMEKRAKVRAVLNIKEELKKLKAERLAAQAS